MDLAFKSPYLQHKPHIKIDFFSHNTKQMNDERKFSLSLVAYSIYSNTFFVSFSIKHNNQQNIMLFMISQVNQSLKQLNLSPVT